MYQFLNFNILSKSASPTSQKSFTGTVVFTASFLPYQYGKFLHVLVELSGIVPSPLGGIWERSDEVISVWVPW
jgi:hypothetical protein